jgi:hypothetical protein
MKKLLSLLLIFSQVAHASNYPIPAPGTTGNVLTSNGSKWASAAASGGLKNYLSGDDTGFNGSVGNWLAYADAAGSQPVDGTGGSPALTCTRTPTNPLSGAGSLLITKDAANRQGNGCAVGFTIDRADLGHTLTVSFSYETKSGTYSAGTDTTDPDLTVYVYGPTDGTPVVTQLSPYKVIGTSVQGAFSGRFTTAASGVAYRLILHEALTGTSAYTLAADSVSVGPTTQVYGPPETDSIATTVTPNGFGTVSLANYWYYRHGDKAHYYGTWKTGTAAASTASISLPTGQVIDSTKLPTTAAQRVGEFTQVRTAVGPGNSPPWDLFYDGSDTAKVYLAFQTGSNIFTKVNASSAVNSSDSVSFEFEVPISGWTSGITMDSSVRNAPTQQVFTSGTAATYTTPAGVKWLEVYAIGGGGGGGASGTTAGGAATDGTASTFGTSLISAGLGVKGVNDGAGGAGGTNTITAPALDAGGTTPGIQGGPSDRQGTAPLSSLNGGYGGGGGAGGYPGGTGAGQVPPANSGGGGGGAYCGQTTSCITGSGGGQGGFVHAIVPNPSPTYLYTVGAAGTGGTLGASGAAGGNGATGKITVVEHYLNAGTVGGDSANTPVSKSANYTAAYNDTTIIFTAAATLALPAAAQVPGHIYHVLSSGASSTVTVDPNASETVCGQTTITLAGTEAIDIQSDGTSWQGLNAGCNVTRKAVLNCDAGSVVTSQDGSNWLTAASITNIASGSCTVTILSGAFSATPSCVASDENTSAMNNFIAILPSAATTLAVRGEKFDNSAFATAFDAGIMCWGKR